MIASPTNEIQQYIDARYLNTAEGVDSLLLFKKHMEWPPVTRLIVHLLGQHNIIFNENEDLAVVAESVARQRTTLIAYFAYNAQNADGQNVVYTDVLPYRSCLENSRKSLVSSTVRRKRLLGECISYILSLVKASSFTSCLISYRAQPLSNISGLLTT